MLHCHASSGGTDILALILKKNTRMKVGKALLCVDFIIASLPLDTLAYAATFNSLSGFGCNCTVFMILGIDIND